MARSHFHLTVSTLDLSTPLVPRGGLSARNLALAAERSATASWLPTTSHSVVRLFPKFLEQSGVELGSRWGSEGKDASFFVNFARSRLSCCQ